MQDGAQPRPDLRQRGDGCGLDVGLGDLAGLELHFRGSDDTLRTPSGDIDENRGDASFGGALSRIDGEPDRPLGMIDIDDHAVADAA